MQLLSLAATIVAYPIVKGIAFLDNVQMFLDGYTWDEEDL